MPEPGTLALLAGLRIGGGVGRFGSFFGKSKRNLNPPASTKFSARLDAFTSQFGFDKTMEIRQKQPFSGQFSDIITSFGEKLGREPTDADFASILPDVRKAIEDVERNMMAGTTDVTDQLIDTTGMSGKTLVMARDRNRGIISRASKRFEDRTRGITGKGLVLIKAGFRGELKRAQQQAGFNAIFTGLRNIASVPQPGGPDFVGPLQPEPQPKRQIPTSDLARLALDFIPKGKAPRLRTGQAGGFTFAEQAKEQDLIIPPGFTMKQPTTLSRAIDPNILRSVV